MKRACWVLSANAMERLRGFDVSSENSDGALEETEISSHESEDDRVGPPLLPLHEMALCQQTNLLNLSECEEANEF